ncbi:hypothetical protein U1Q18_009808 [Sarracenia purpurea var. burkii]
MVTQGTLRKTILGVGVKRLSGGSRVFGGVCFGDFPISAKQEQRRLGRVSMDEGVAEIEESDYSEESESTENCRIEAEFACPIAAYLLDFQIPAFSVCPRDLQVVFVRSARCFCSQWSFVVLLMIVQLLGWLQPSVLYALLGEYEVESGETTNQGRSALVFSKGIEVKKVNVIELDNTVLTSESPSAVLRTGSKLLKIISTSESLSDSVEEGCDKGVYVDGVSGEEDDGSSAENDSMEEGVPGQDRPSGNEVSKDYGDDVLDSELGDFGSKSGEDTDFGSKSVSLSKELKEEYVHFTAETKKADMTEGTSQLFSCNLSQRIDDKDLGTVDNLERVSGGEEVGPKVAMAGVILDAHYVFDKMPQSNPKGHHQISEAKQDGLLSAKFCDGLSNSNEVSFAIWWLISRGPAVILRKRNLKMDYSVRSNGADSFQ